MLALCGLGLLIGAGFLFRLAVPWLGRLLLPASLVAGFLGLAAGPHGLGVVPQGIVDTWSTLPGLLINVVFAGLFLGAPLPAVSSIARQAGPLIRFSVIGAFGQYLVGFAITWLLLTPVFGVSALFGCLIEIGFSGGHGTASAMGPVFTAYGFPAGGALGQMSATVGILVGVVGGVLLVQWATRSGYVDGAAPGGVRLPQDVSGLLPPDQRRAIATSTVSSVAVEPFALHASVALVAVLIGWVMLEGLRRAHPVFANFPLFPLAMAGGGLLQGLAQRTGAAAYFDRPTFQRLSGLALDLLVTAAVASMRLDLFVQNLAPFTLLMVAGTVWCIGSFVWLAPRMLAAPWFEPAIVVYGTQTAVAAVGLMLLRIVDPHHKTAAAQTFAARSAVIAPLLGGGLVTATMPLLVAQFGIAAMLAASAAAMGLAWVWPGRYRVTR